MNFSKSFLDHLRSSVSLSDLIGEKVLWDPKKTKSSQGDFWGPCPFHEEKTASFHVDSNKGFYYCFGCQAKGDCFTFLKDHERFSFLESVTYLAKRAGISLPSNTSNTRKNNETEGVLFLIHNEASSFFQEQLKTTSALECRQYLQAREITEEASEHFELGFAPNSRNALFKYLQKKKFETKFIISSGLCMTSEKNTEPFDRFRNRLMFPIKDTKGKVIAFGGRSLDTSAPAKYLNSPETPLFSKGKLLYNYLNAKMSARSKTPLLLVEGYMDVVALFQAGFSNAVAPLGTAITGSQLHLLWVLHPEPVVLFDGDKAGQNAANKLLAISLPFLEPNKSVRFGQLPNNQDPDDLLKSEGRKGLLSIIEKAQPAINVLWANSTEGWVFDSPERKAALDIRLRESINSIKNTDLRNHFFKAIKEIKNEFFSNSSLQRGVINSAASQKIGQRRKSKIATPLQETKNSLVGRPSTNLSLELRLKEGTVILGCINHPTIAYKLENELSRLKFTFSDLQKIRDAILAEIPIPKDASFQTFYQKINARLKFDVLEKLKQIPQLKFHPHLKPEASTLNATKAIDDAIKHQKSLINYQTEIKLAEDAFSAEASEAITNRIALATKTLQETSKGSERQTLNADELSEASSKRLNKMIQEQIWVKKK